MTQSEDFAKAIAFAWWVILKMFSFLEYLVFFEAVFCTEELEMICRMDFDMVFGILIFDRKWGFCKGYGLFMWAILKRVSSFEYLVFFEAVFCTEQLEMICRMDFDMFFKILIFDSKWGFCKGYSVCMIGDFENGLISRIFSVFWSAFWNQQLQMVCSMDFDMFFGILIFDPKWGFCKGYSLCMMGDFENGLISRIFSVFWSGFLQ